jgi:hypothetical protein
MAAQKDFVDGLKTAAKIEINEPNLAKVRIDTSQASGADDGHGRDLPPLPMSPPMLPPSGPPDRALVPPDRPDRPIAP